MSLNAQFFLSIQELLPHLQPPSHKRTWKSLPYTAYRQNNSEKVNPIRIFKWVTFLRQYKKPAPRAPKTPIQKSPEPENRS